MVVGDCRGSIIDISLILQVGTRIAASGTMPEHIIGYSLLSRQSTSDAALQKNDDGYVICLSLR